jgi:hypothetical protein
MYVTVVVEGLHTWCIVDFVTVAIIRRPICMTVDGGVCSAPSVSGVRRYRPICVRYVWANLYIHNIRCALLIDSVDATFVLFARPPKRQPGA